MLEIVQVGDPVLRAVAQPVEVADLPALAQLIDEMRDTMRAAPGVGLAAPQIGRSLSLAVIEDAPTLHTSLAPEQLAARERSAVPFHVIVNPTIEPVGTDVIEAFEGCLSFKGFVMMVPRFRSVRVEALDEHGVRRVIEATGWYARILQHEIDHLNGTLYIDRMNTRTFSSARNMARGR